MAKRTGNELLLHDRVIATVDLPGVPAGTPGKVILLNGWDRADGRAWARYRVLFDIGGPNGTDVGSLSRGVLLRTDKLGNIIEGEATPV